MLSWMYWRPYKREVSIVKGKSLGEGKGRYQCDFEEDFPYSEFVESFDVAVVSKEDIERSVFT